MFRLIQKRLRNQKGFTLVELMVVVVIIGILVAIAVPAYNRVTENAEAKACAANIRIIEGAIQVYKAEHGDYPNDIDDLESDYLTSVPTCPSDETSYTYDNSTGSVTCTKHPDQSDAQGSGDNG